MADGTVELTSEGVGPTVDTELVTGTTTHRQRIVIAGASSAAMAYPITTVPSTSTYALPIRIVGPTTSIYLGASTELTGRISSGSQTIGTVVMSSGLGASTAIIGSLSSGTAQIGILGPSSANVIGTVAQSSNWNLSTAAIINLSSAIANYVTNSTTVPVYLGNSTTNIVGIVGLSSAAALSSGTAYVGTVVSASSGLVYFSTTTNVGLTTTNLIGFSTTANLILSQTTAGAVGSSAIFVGGGIVASTASTLTAQTSGTAQNFIVDRMGALTVNLEGPRQFIKTANLVTVANTCFQQLIATPGANLVNDIVSLMFFSTVVGGSTTVPMGIITVLSSCGQALPGVWNTKVFFWNQYSTMGGEAQYYSFPIPLTQLTANNAWGIYSSGTAINVTAQYVVGTS